MKVEHHPNHRKPRFPHPFQEWLNPAGCVPVDNIDYGGFGVLAFADSPFLQMTMDTGNVFIAGEDPVRFLARFLKRVGHVHLKDVAPRLSETARGTQTGIGMSHCSLGEGVNAQNIRRCLELLRDRGFQGAVSLECEAQGGPVLERSILWIRQVLQELEIASDLT